MEEIRTRFQNRVLSDFLYENPVDQFQARARRRRIIVFAIVGVVLIAILTIKR